LLGLVKRLFASPRGCRPPCGDPPSPSGGFSHPNGLGLIASNFGGAKHPAWYHNLKANPEATVSIDGDTWQATARLATPRERDEIWANGSSCTRAGRSTKHGLANAT
jgi:deazaflavin-dependent oxidoreductase (nitroreductase family)